METTKDYKAEEMAVGAKAARLLEASLGNFIGKSTVRNTGKLLASKTRARPGEDGLKDLVITSPRYGFMLNYGYEGVKTNGIKMKLQATNHLADAIEKSKVLEVLADELTDIKGEKVMATINFRARG